MGSDMISWSTASILVSKFTHQLFQSCSFPKWKKKMATTLVPGPEACTINMATRLRFLHPIRAFFWFINLTSYSFASSIEFIYISLLLCHLDMDLRSENIIGFVCVILLLPALCSSQDFISSRATYYGSPDSYGTPSTSSSSF